MSTFTIGEVAARSGFTASALRYYEGIGLVAPAARTGAGYRLYDDHALARLAFIARAKQLGCSLEEIIDLISLWDGERCGPVQRRLHELVTNKVQAAQRQVAEVAAFTGQLQEAAAQLAGSPTDGPCGDGCACVATPSAPTTLARVALTANPTEPPIACTLDPDALPDRVAEWQAVLSSAGRRTTTPDGSLRVELGGGVDLEALARLVASEQACCSFFAFAITVDHRGAALEVGAPDGAGEVVTSLFGAPA